MLGLPWLQKGWPRALQDAERAMSVIRSRAEEFNLDPKKIGLVGYSAGGQVAARLLCGRSKTYRKQDEIDDASHAPNFGVLIYPWNIYDAKSDALIDGIKVHVDVPPCFLVHTDDDRSSSLGAVYFYAGLKKLGINSELHVYRNGGHGYGSRPVPGSYIGTWPERLIQWMTSMKWIEG
ncbi:MAG: alpha/beta hydrolase [Planctomycetota bacterium]